MTGATSISGDYQWEDLGNQDWEARAQGVSLTYAGARSGFFDTERNSMRLRSTMTVHLTGLRPARLWLESGFDRLAKWAGYAVEVQTGDAAFDKRIYLGADDAALADHLAANPDLRRAVERVFDSGVRHVTISDGGVVGETRSLYPDDNGWATLTEVAQPLLKLGRLWPRRHALPPARSSLPVILAYMWWLVVTGLSVAYVWFSNDEVRERQTELLVNFDAAGVAAYCAIALAPTGLLLMRRARSHRVLLLLLILSVLVGTFGRERLLEIGANQLVARAEKIVPATLLDIRPNPEGLHPYGYEAVIQVYEQKTHWELTPAEGQLAREGRLCVAAVEAEGLRGLRYVKAVKTWRCRPGEENPALPPIDGETR